MNVFIADDSHVVRERLVNMLQRIDGVNIVGLAVDAPQALADIPRLNPDVAILDIHMPGGSGIDVLGELRRQGFKFVAIMLTNYPLPQYRNHSMANGADYFFDKTTEFREVSRVLKERMAGNADAR